MFVSSPITLRGRAGMYLADNCCRQQLFFTTVIFFLEGGQMQACPSDELQLRRITQL